MNAKTQTANTRKTVKTQSLADLLNTEGVRNCISFDALWTVCKSLGLIGIKDKAHFRKCANNSIIRGYRFDFSREQKSEVLDCLSFLVKGLNNAQFIYSCDNDLLRVANR